MIIYIIGSLRNPRIPEVANQLEAAGHEAFSDWFGAGERADDCWREYEIRRGRTYVQALKGYAARHVFAFDRFHIERADAVVLVAPAGKSGHLEMGWALGQGKRGYYLLEPNNERWDVMLQFCTAVVETVPDLLKEIKNG
jgi:hypothetical protein